MPQKELAIQVTSPRGAYVARTILPVTSSYADEDLDIRFEPTTEPAEGYVRPRDAAPLRGLLPTLPKGEPVTDPEQIKRRVTALPRVSVGERHPFGASHYFQLLVGTDAKTKTRTYMVKKLGRCK